jgi:hypothetical protein
VTVPGTGSWSIAVWLSDAAGNTNPANAAHTNVIVAPPNPVAGNTRTATNPKVHVTESLRGRELVVQVTRPTNGNVRVGFTGRLHGRIVASGAKTIALKHGRLTATFRLGPQTAAHALIRVTAWLDHEAPVTSTLQRDHHPTR